MTSVAVFCADLTRLAYDQVDRCPAIIDDGRVARAAEQLWRMGSGYRAARVDPDALELIREVTAQGMAQCADAKEIADILDASAYHLQGLVGRPRECLGEAGLGAT